MKKAVTRQDKPSYITTRGDVCVANNIDKKGNIVQEFKLGNTRVKICDDYYRNRTAEEVDEILARIAEKAQKHLSAQG